MLPFLVGFCLVVMVTGCRVSEEFTWSGVGRGRTWLPLRGQTSFCFLSSARGWNHSGCRVEFDPVASAGAVEFSSGLDEFLCGVRCVSHCVDLVDLTPETILAGQGSHVAALVPTNCSACFFTHGQTWFKDAERCAIVVTGQFWALSSDSQQDSFVCGSQCVTSNSSIIVTPQALLTGFGPKSGSLLPVAQGFCFLSQGRMFFRGGESCRVRVNGLFWELATTSGQERFECGSRCIRLASESAAQDMKT